jgi:GDP/UDP-N,N'-diacetylbacillosamine 2-epimerase (hydrolysing)
MNIFFTKANSDMSGRKINEEINHFVKEHDNSYLFSSLGHLRYHSLLKIVDAMIGNSSSGIVESPSWKIPTINIGDRQEGRLQAKSIINALPEYNSIKKALKKLHSSKFQQKITTVKSPYGSGNTSDKIIKILKQTDLTSILKKKFYDLK